MRSPFVIHACAWIGALVTSASVAVAQPSGAPPPVAASEAPRAGELRLDDVLANLDTQLPLLTSIEQERVIADAQALSAEGGFDPLVRARATTIPTGPYPQDRVDFLVEQPTAIWGAKLFGGYRISRGDIAPYDGKLVTGGWGEGRLGVAVPVWRDGPIDKRRAALQKAELGQESAGQSVQAKRIKVYLGASLRYWKWVGAGRKVAIERDLLDLALTRAAQVSARVERGDVPAYERTENERVVEQRRARLVAASRELEQAAISLSLYYRGDDGAPRLPDASRVPNAVPEPATLVPDQARDERVALENRPELRSLEAKRRQAEVDRRLADNQRKPAIDLIVAGAKDFGPADDKILKPELEASLVLEIPILTRVQDGRFKEAEAKMTSIAAEARFARDSVVADVRDAASATRAAQGKLEALRREIEASSALVTAETQRFSLGETTLLIVNLREQALADARKREVDALVEYRQALAARTAALGQLPVTRPR